MDMFKRIVLVRYEMSQVIQSSAQRIVKKLLVRNEQARLGNLANGYLDVKKEPWFNASGIDFKKVIRKEAVVPWKPQVQSASDSSYFADMTSHENERTYGRRLTRDEQERFKGF